jgi:hypothetical protein
MERGTRVLPAASWMLLARQIALSPPGGSLLCGSSIPR